MVEYFSGLFGNEAIKRRLCGAIKDNVLSHAHLISGPEGSGKMTLALEISASLNCENRHNPCNKFPCHSCNNCRRIFDGSFTDVKILSKQNDKATIGVSEIRYFREDMFLSASESDAKIYIIDDAEKMTPNAQNALLKVLEEPPSAVYVFLLTTSDDAILTTIKSRTQYTAMERFELSELMKYFSSNPSASEELLMSADGCIGKAKLLLSEGASEVKIARETVNKILLALKPGTPYSTLYTAIKGLPIKKDELRSYLEFTTVALRDLLLLKHDRGAPLTFFTSRDDGIKLSESMPSARINAIYEIMREALVDLSKNVNVNSLVTILGARIKLI